MYARVPPPIKAMMIPMQETTPTKKLKELGLPLPSLTPLKRFMPFVCVVGGGKEVDLD